MITKRIIPCLDVRNGRVVKGKNFEGIQDVSDPVEMAKFYNREGADELVFYDITASVEERGLFTDILRKVASEIFIPLTVGGGINTLEDFDRVLKCGADKVSVNSGAIRNPNIIGQAAKKYGDQCVVLSMDIKRVDGVFRLFAKGDRCASVGSRRRQQRCGRAGSKQHRYRWSQGRFRPGTFRCHRGSCQCADHRIGRCR